MEYNSEGEDITSFRPCKILRKNFGCQPSGRESVSLIQLNLKIVLCKHVSSLKSCITTETFETLQLLMSIFKNIYTTR